jgi:hypothetical protein
MAGDRFEVEDYPKNPDRWKWSGYWRWPVTEEGFGQLDCLTAMALTMFEASLWARLL